MTFLFELFKNYLNGGPSYRNPNISKILKFTYSPKQNNKSDIKTHSGVIKDNLTNRNDIFQRNEIINFKDMTKEIQIPKLFSSKMINKLISKYGFNVKYGYLNFLKREIRQSTQIF